MAGVLRQSVTDRWAIYNADCMDVLAALPSCSVQGTVYSPPFMGLYHYSSSDRDHSNARTPEEFRAMYGLVIGETLRITEPGRTVGVHAAVVPSGNSGRDSLYDFPGDVIRLHQEAGFEFIARHVIWKEPLAVRLRTMAKNLAHKTIIDNAAHAGYAAPDELLVFRKPGADSPVTHPVGLTEYYGGQPVPADLNRFRGWNGDQKQNRYSHWIWRRYASSVWDDIRIDRVLPFRDAKDEDDEKHVHPLQLDVIARYVQMRTLPGERVFTPYMGVGSEVFESVRLGRVGIGAELKPSYYVQAERNLAEVDREIAKPDEIDFYDEGEDLA